jgi:alkylhydroperoxidase family enzyme
MIMPWTPWIAIEANDTANEQVQRVYNRTRDEATGRPPDLVRLTSLTPQAAGLLYDLQRTVYNGAAGLTPREKEIAALIVSVYNGCVH